MDPFEKKRGMIQELLGMLKKHASDEVSSGLQHPEGEGDMHGIQAEKVEIIPGHKMDEPTPEHDVVTHDMHDGGMAGYSEGGVVDKVNAKDPTPKIHSGPIPYESADGQPDKEGSAHEEATESESEREAEGNISPMHSMFESFLSRKKKK